VPRSARRRAHEEPASSQSPPITIEEAKRRRLWGVYRLRKGIYVSATPGLLPASKWVAWAVDAKAADRACVERGRDERLYGQYQEAERIMKAIFRRPAKPRPPRLPRSTDPERFSCGHPRTPKNSYVYKSRGATCLKCRRARSRADYDSRGLRKKGTP
jgi:hypothetical protein